MSKVQMGEGSYGNIHLIGDGGDVIVGKYTSIAEGVRVVSVGHGPNKVSTYPFNSKEFRNKWKGAKAIPRHPIKYGTTFIGNDCWIGQDVLILGGSYIRDGAIIGAGSVVRGNISPYSIALGNPIIEVDRRFNIAQIVKLLEIKWWDWNRDKIEKALPLLCTESIEEFIRRFG